MSKTLILLFHPDLARSRANAMLVNAAADLPDVEVVDMQALYPDNQIDADIEVTRLLSADRLVLQFPIQWYSPPPLLKAWQNNVLTRMFYFSYETEGRFLEGTPLLVVATAGNVPEAYSPIGVNLFPLASLLNPLRATANRCGLPWASPYLVYAADKLDTEALIREGNRYVEHLKGWREETSGAVNEIVQLQAMAG